MKALNLQDKLLYGIGILGVLALFFMTSTNPFFWDTIQFGSEHPSYFYSINLNGFLLPSEIDSGHVPAFGWYIAAMWTIFGKSVLVSHLALFPFVIGILWQLIVLSKHYVTKTFSPLLFLALLLEPTLLGQITLVSPDVCLVFFLLMALNSINKKKRIFLLISILGLMITSNRGAMVAFCLFLYHVILLWIAHKGIVKTVLLKVFLHGLWYVPGAFIFIIYNSYHYIQTGWIGYHENMTWAACFERVDFLGFLRNVAIYGWRLLDSGRLAVWVLLIFILFKYKLSILKLKGVSPLLILMLLFVLLLPLNMLWAKNLMGPRYLLPIFIIVTLTTTVLFTVTSYNERFKKAVLSLICISLISGHFYIYPNKISQGWDASLAYLPYFELKDKMVSYLKDENIDFEEVEAFFPSQGKLGIYKLDNDNRFLDGYTGASNYVIYSNINNVSDIVLENLEHDYVLVKEFKSNGIFYRLYERHKNNG